jgi:copper chaperone CopZ
MAQETKVFNISGMTCNHCVMAVTRALKSVPGVDNAKVDLDSEKATVTLNPDLVTDASLIKAVKEAGYDVVQ